MKARNKILLLALCMAALIAVSVIGTMAYLTSTDKVINTFTVGKVDITLDEAKVNDAGVAVTPAERVKANSYKLMPGHSYTKDPTVHVTDGSENCYIFVKVENGISAFEAANEESTDGYKTIATQIITNGWTKLADNDNVYYRSYTNGENAQKSFTVFSNFKIADNANNAEATKTSWNAVTAENTKITVTAYAIQADGFANADAAWAAANFN